MNQIFTRKLISVLLILIFSKTSLFGQSNQPADGTTDNKDIGKSIKVITLIFFFQNRLTSA